MRLTKWILVGAAAALLTTPAFATTYWGGFEDTSGSGADYDYNDLIFSITGTSLTLHTTTGVWFDRASAGVLNPGTGANGLAGTPFWNNTSLDGPGGRNVGFAIYGGGALNGGVGLAPGDQYLATATGTSVNDVYFSVSGDVSEQVAISVTAATDALGWQLRTGGAIHLFAPGVQGPVTFTPGTLLLRQALRRTRHRRTVFRTSRSLDHRFLSRRASACWALLCSVAAWLSASG